MSVIDFVDPSDEVWPPVGTPLADLLELMVLKAITKCTIASKGIAEFTVLGSTSDFSKKLTMENTVAFVPFDELVGGGSFSEGDLLVRHLAQNTTFHEATAPLCGRVFTFRVLLNWSQQTAQITTIRDHRAERGQ